MTLQYILSGGQLKLDKRIFAAELLLPGSLLKKLLNADESEGNKQPRIIRSESLVTIDFNDSVNVILDEGFYDLFKKLKLKYKEKMKGRVVIQITALTSIHVVLDLNSEDDKVIYE